MAEIGQYAGETTRIGRGRASSNHIPGIPKKKKFHWRNYVWTREGGSDTTEKPKKIDNRKERLCKFWAAGNCVKGDRCPYLHSWFLSDQVSHLATLQGHNKVITGIALPSGRDKLYSSSKDGTLRVWNCHNGQCEHVFKLGAQVGCLISNGPWIFVGLPNVVKVWNVQSNAEYSLDGPVGQVHTMIFDEDKLFAGTQSGQILARKVSTERETANPFKPAHPLEGPTHGVVCLTIGHTMLYSGSMDGTIKEWDLGLYNVS